MTTTNPKGWSIARYTTKVAKVAIARRPNTTFDANGEIELVDSIDTGWGWIDYFVAKPDTKVIVRSYRDDGHLVRCDQYIIAQEH